MEKYKVFRIVKTALKKKNNIGRLTLADFGLITKPQESR